jgi:hypothetical protein
MNALVAYGSDSESEEPVPCTPSKEGNEVNKVDSPSKSPEPSMKRAEPSSPEDEISVGLEFPFLLFHGSRLKFNQIKFKKWKSLMNQGLYFNDRLENTPAFRNPSIISKLIDFLGVDEFGTNLDPKVFDPKGFPPEAYYDRLSKKFQWWGISADERLDELQVQKTQAKMEANKTPSRQIQFTPSSRLDQRR